MMYFYLKALHIIFVVTWFAGLFYIVRLLIYNTEAQEKAEPERSILTKNFNVMIRRLWLGITWPSAILTLLLGPWLWYILWTSTPDWLLIKVIFVVGLYAYHWILHRMYRQQMRGEFRYTSMQLRIWNEVATVFLVAIVMLATVKQGLSVVWGLVGLVAFIILLMSAIKIYKIVRERQA